MTIPEWLHFVPVDFEAGESWWEQLIAAGFDKRRPAIVVSTGVSMYLSKESGFKKLQYVSANDLYLRYFANRSDALNAGTAEGFLVGTS